MSDTVVAIFGKFYHPCYQNNLINSFGLVSTRLNRNFGLKMHPLIFISPIFSPAIYCYEMRHYLNKIIFFMKLQ